MPLQRFLAMVPTFMVVQVILNSLFDRQFGSASGVVLLVPTSFLWFFHNGLLCLLLACLLLGI